ncbi:hypothetical protein BVC80_1065g43 [Macleaya cordata]|uniref:Transmembrane protein n=1 Tax=Macleaya cordata TaxID=56857 RepID=A0A200RCT6_MACCD|nr:hypothetical protein BVC80_1065g43 [Macleaya cordata]
MAIKIPMTSFASVCLIIAMFALMGISEVVAHEGHHHGPSKAPAPAPGPSTKPGGSGGSSAAVAFSPAFVTSAFFASAGFFLPFLLSFF